MLKRNSYLLRFFIIYNAMTESQYSS